MTSTQHPTLAGVTVYEHRDRKGMYPSRRLVSAGTADESVLVSAYGYKHPAWEFCATINGRITAANAETVIAMIRDQAAWLESQGETK